MKELTPELYTELNATIRKLREEKKELDFDKRELQEQLHRNEIEKEQAEATTKKTLEEIELLKNSIYSPKLNEIRLFVKDYLDTVILNGAHYDAYNDKKIIDPEVMKVALRCNSYMVWAYLLSDKEKLDKAALVPPKDNESLEEYLSRLQEKEKGK